MNFPEYDWCKVCDDWIIWTESNGKRIALDIEPVLVGYSVETFGTIRRHRAHQCKGKPKKKGHG